MIVDINDEQNKLTNLQVNLLKDVLLHTSKKEGVGSHAELSLSIVLNDDIQQLNKQYRNINEPTDVLSFQMDNPFEKNPDIPIMLGDIIISYDKVVEQAERYNHSFERELLFLAIHGFLHLLRYTHESKEKEQEMFEKQESILKEFNLERK